MRVLGLAKKYNHYAVFQNVRLITCALKDLDLMDIWFSIPEVKDPFDRAFLIFYELTHTYEEKDLEKFIDYIGDYQTSSRGNTNA